MRCNDKHKEVGKCPDVAVVIASHKYCYPLERCIEGHCQQMRNSGDVIFVDNGSGGELAGWINEYYPDITLLERESNGYFCGGYNTGIQYAIDNNYDYVLIVNADTEVINTAYINAMVNVASMYEDAAFIGPKVYFGDENTVQNTVLEYPWIWRYMFNWVSRLIFKPNFSESLKREEYVDFLNGVCVLCRVSALKEVGLMDDVMGGYVEDTDWSWRARKKGWLSLYAPLPSIIHHQEKSEYRNYTLKSFMLRRNHVYWHMKNKRLFQALAFAFFSMFLAIIRLFLSWLTRNNVEQHVKYVRSYFIVCKNLLSKKKVGAWFGPPIGEF